ncbi:hypothetical protein DNTS_004669 [Danionella cerebrum]|uniref:CKK domain-containing protein n=1 Tax=Danionella cerebrum TaxID=2873325 RepID=A0A553QYH6_9TELE|nr:hypothetical protein DNTS_004669 [Danionella translucida]
MDVGALGDGGPRRVDSSEGALDIVPLDMYDSARAKIEADLRWLFAKAYGEDHVPAALRDVFYVDQYSVEHIKPDVLSLLVSSELYCRVCVLLLRGEQPHAISSHQAVLQTLARRGICVREPDNSPVTHHQLSSTPIKMSAHIPLIDALMLAYTVEMMPMERVVACVKRFSSFCASKELPLDTEDAMLFWINKVRSLTVKSSVEAELNNKVTAVCLFRRLQVILKTRDLSERELKMKQPLMDSPCHQKSPSKWYWKLVPPDLMHALAHCMLEPVELSRVVRYRREHLSGRAVPHLSVMEDLMKDVCDGAALLALVHFYCPDLMRLDDICLKEVPSLSDSVYNIHLLREFCNEYLNSCFYLHPEDLLYGPPVLKNNLMVLIAELFWWFEMVKPDFVKPRDLQEMKDVRASLQPKSSCSHVPLSNATKRSFLTASPSADSLADGCLRYYLHSEESVSLRNRSPSPSRSLLPLRHKQQKSAQGEISELRNRSNSLPISQMETDWERVCGDDISLARSISKDSLASNVISITPRHRVNGQSLPQTRQYENQEEEEELLAIVNPGGGSTSRDGFFLEPLQPAVLRPNKEKRGVSKHEESGEGQGKGYKGRSQSTSYGEQGFVSEGRSHGYDIQGRSQAGKGAYLVNQTFSPIGSRTQSPGSFFLHSDGERVRHSPLGGWEDVVSDSEFEDDDDDEEEELEVDNQELSKALLVQAGRKCLEMGLEEESAKLCEDVCLRERDDKESVSGRSSPCPSVMSQASSTSTGRMTSFAERRRHRVGFPDGCYSTGSSQTTTPDGSESMHFPSDASPGTPAGRPGVASELVHLRMQLEEKRRAIELQKKKMENMSARQRQQLGKAAFLHVVKKGRSDTLPHPLKMEISIKEKVMVKDDACVEVLKARGKDSTSSSEANRLNITAGGGASEDVGGEPDLSECSRSIELLNEAIGAIQQQMMQLSLQQDLLIKQTIQEPKPNTVMPEQRETKARFSVQFTETLSTATKRPPKLSSSRTPRTKPSDLKLSKDTRVPAKANTPGGRTPRAESEEEGVAKENGRGAKGIIRNSTFRLQDSPQSRSDSLESPQSEIPAVQPVPLESEASRNENVSLDEGRAKAQLIEVDLSDPTEAEADGEQKAGLGFFFKDDQKAEDELAKKRAAFLLKQQRKAEEARVRKQQLEAESELKRDEARRKADEERVRKEEEKARRELIKQEYLRRKQQELLEEQGVAKPRPRNRRPRPKSLHRTESSCSAPVSLCSAPSGSSLSLASVATEGDSVASGGASSHRGGSVESFPILSRNASRNMERDWDNGSTASSVTEYNGPRLFKEPSAKSNKAIIQNAIAHCCLAGKVNEAQKNAILEDIERCEANHLIILFRDGGCQFRALYIYSPETEEIVKLRGTGPRSISRKMIDRLYKYSSDRKQFTVIPARSVSVSVDALTIHSHLWQAKRPSTARRK